MAKNKRQQKILEIIGRGAIETQEALIEQLKACGFSCTQSTVSRDIKELHLIKESVSGGRYRYVVSEKKEEFDAVRRLQKILRECYLSSDSAGNIIVLQTMPGLANAAGAALDAMEKDEMLGCISGNNTVMIIMRSDEAAAQFCREIDEICR